MKDIDQGVIGIKDGIHRSIDDQGISGTNLQKIRIHRPRVGGT
jgi:hypothetical protein